LRPLTVLLVSAASCAAPAVDLPLHIERDSAGVRIIEVQAVDPAPIAATVDMRPHVDIGTLDGPPWFALHRVSHALFLPDSRIAVATHDSNQVYVYDSTGAFLERFGRTGVGPGEFRAIEWIGVGPDDSLAILDAFWPEQVSFFDAEFRFGRRVPAVNASGLGELVLHGMFADGAFLASAQGGSPCNDFPAPPGLQWNCVRYYRSDARAGRVDTIAGRYPWQIPGKTTFYVFGPRSQAAAADSGFYYTYAMTPEVRRYHADGRLEWIARVPRPPRPVTQAMIDAFDKRRNATVHPAVLARSRSLGPPHYATHQPAYDALIAAKDGGAWARHSEYPADSAAVWDVFDARGLYRGVVRMPTRLTVFSADSRRVLGVWRDSLDIEHVRVYRVVK